MRSLVAMISLAAAVVSTGARADEPRLTRPPRLLRSPAARYPAEEQAAGITGAVLLSLDVDVDGHVTRAEVAESAGARFDAAALDAVRQFVFEPAEVDGHPAPVRITYRYAFVLRAKAPPPASPPLPPPAAPARPVRIYESTVRGQAPSAGPVETRVAAEEARRVPGSEGDVLKVVENLPGVARPSFGSQQLVVWGAATSETRVLVDGVEIPSLYHAGGLRSTVNGDLVRSVALTPGGYEAPYGRGLGGLVRVETRDLPADGVHGYVAADVLDASALLSASIGKRFQIAAAARYSWLDRILGGLVSPQVQSYFPIPRWDDYQVKATLHLDEGETLSLLFLASDDHVRRSLPANDPAEARSDASDASSYRVMIPYRRRAADGATTELTPFFGFDRQAQTTAFGGQPTSLQADVWRFGARASHTRSLARPLMLAVGVDLAGSRSRIRRVGSLTAPGREGDLYVFGQPPGDDLNVDDFTALQFDAAPWAQAELRWGALTITSGLRVDANFVEGNHLVPTLGSAPVVGFQRIDWSVDPRLALRLRAHRRVSLTASCGLYHQQPDPADLSPVFGNPQLTPARALHVTAGVELRLTETLGAELIGYYKQLDGLASRNPAPSPPVGAALVQEGTGTSYGGQLLLRQQLWRGLFGWISYTVGRSERRDHPNGPVRLFDFDQTHLLTVVASYEWRHWAFGARFRYASGYPRTPVTGGYYDVRDDRFDPLFGAQNSVRLPDFIQLDLRVDRGFVWSRAALDLYLEVQNVTYQRNPEEIVYNESYSRPGYITGLPTLAVLGARLGF